MNSFYVLVSFTIMMLYHQLYDKVSMNTHMRKIAKAVIKEMITDLN